MPSHFDRFRLLNDGGNRRFRNESEKMVYLRPGDDGQPPVSVAPGEEWPLPESPEGETLIEVENNLVE